MTRRKGLVLDPNILLRAVFGQRVRELLETFEDAVSFYSPDVCFAGDPRGGYTVAGSVVSVVENATE